MRLGAAMLGLVLAIPAGYAADTAAPQEQQAKPAPQAMPEDVSSQDAIVKALYEVISGPAGKARDWGRFRSLFHPEARLMPTAVNPQGERVIRVVTPEGYIERSSPFFAKDGFYENEVARKTEQFGNIAHLFSTYESRHAPGEKPFSRGINSIQLYHDGQRWWVMSVMWDSERTDNPIPEKYLK